MSYLSLLKNLSKDDPTPERASFSKFNTFFFVQSSVCGKIYEVTISSFYRSAWNADAV